ncbi:hypothetical protein LWI28_022436 [Acer negundo]|uniref:Plus3 domain-containing protein n=1 Tax=Acer negundo TaxID=4023 RepID=A0AAD5NYI3_ACENE|nr:hypothetical protein LWI28_022436 [Acer negundo]
MADLENLLLEAAGRTNTTGRNRHSLPPSRRGHEGSDSGSDSRDDDSDEDHGYTNRKPSGSQVPLKKRGPTDRDDDQGSQEEGDFDDGGSDREGDSSNDSDNDNHVQMTELEREMMIFERDDKKVDKNLMDKFRSRREEKPTRSRKETPPLPSSRGVRLSARSADRAAAKDDALNELRAKRLKQQDPEGHRRLRDASRGSSGGRGYSPIKPKSFTPASLSSSSQSDSESRSHSEDEGSMGDGADSDDDRGMPGTDGLKFDDIKEITIRRSKLGKWFMEPFFEELIVGCFVRVGIGRSKTGPIYRLCLVRNVDATEPDRSYKLENRTTYKYLNVTWGNESSAARWQMAMISDSAPLEEEFKQWVREVERSGGRMPTKHDILEKKEAIQKINTFVYSAATVKQMLQEKKSASSRPLNIAAEKDRLRRELDAAISRHDEAEVERIKKRLLQLEASREPKVKDAKAIRLAEMNRKNRVENFKNASEMKPVNTSLKAGEAGYDPFSRRWTRSINYYVSKPGEGDTGAAANGGNNDALTGANGNGAGTAVASESGMAATAAALEAAAGAGKLIDTSAPVDYGTESNFLHDFDIDISLNALKKFGGPQGVLAGFMARKQRIEATVGLSVQAMQTPFRSYLQDMLTLLKKENAERNALGALPLYQCTIP